MTLAGKAYQTTVQVRNPAGLHMRPAMEFVDVANRYRSAIMVSDGETETDGKSIMGLTMLAATCGTTLTISAEGEDGEEAVDALRQIVDTVFEQ